MTICNPSKYSASSIYDLSVSDLTRSVDFYERILPALGFRWLADDPDNVRWANAGLTIGLRAADSTQRGTAFNRYRAGLHHVAFKALSRADIDRFHRFLVQAEVTILDAPAEYPQYGDGYYAMFFADPDGMAHFPWGDWKTTQLTGRDQRARYSRS